jgi:hypothetical protein
MLYAVAACFTRQSLLLFYYRLVQDGSMKLYRRAIHVASVYSVVTMLALVILTLNQCAWVPLIYLTCSELTDFFHQSHSCLLGMASDAQLSLLG